jgi:hypothetical protein
VGVGGPGVGAPYAFYEMPQGRAGRGPHPERPVHVDPGVEFLGGVADLVEGIDGAGVHVARLGAHYGWSRGLGEGMPRRVRPHPALGVGRDRLQAGGPNAQEAQGAVYGDMPLFADDDADRRRARQPVGLDVPTGRLEHAVARGSERGEVGHLAAGHQRVRGVPGQPKQVDQPRAADLLDHRGRGRGRVEAGVLVPGRGEPVRGEGGREATSDYEPEEPAARRGHDPSIGRLGELRDDQPRIVRAVG